MDEETPRLDKFKEVTRALEGDEDHERFQERVSKLVKRQAEQGYKPSAERAAEEVAARLGNNDGSAKRVEKLDV